MNKKLLALFMLVFGMTLLAACDSDDDAPPPPVTLTGISISPTAVPDGLPIGVTQQFTATGTYSDNSVQDISTAVIWTSSTPATASVDGNGLATGQAAGTADITASDSGFTSNTVALEVLDQTVTLVSITVAPAVVPVELDLGRSLQFQAEGVFSNNKSYDITGYVAWDSSIPAFATIDQSGLATAASAGTTSISASAATETSNVVALTTESKSYPPVDALTIEPQNPVALPVGRRQQLVAVLVATDGTLQNVTDTATWETSDRNIAGVDTAPSSTPGLVSGFSIGTVTITATDSGQQGTVEIVVNDATIETVTILPQNPVDLPAGHTQAFTATGTFSDGVTRILKEGNAWSVSDRQIGLIENVTATGVIARFEALAQGNVDVIYTDWDLFGDKTDKQDSVPLTVTAGVLQSIELLPDSPPPVSKAAGSSQQFDAYGTFGGGAIRRINDDVIWDSSDTAVGVFDIEIKGRLTTLPGTAGQTTIASVSMLNANDLLITSNLTTVEVNTATLDSLFISNEPPVVLGETVQFMVTGDFTNGDQSDYTDRVTWSTDDTDIATVSNAEGTKGQVTGVSVGTTTIRALDPISNVEDTDGLSVSQP
jgi:hypothetical protein